ncbi:MAG: phage tail tape measure protein, partial [Ruminococcus sp.]|nr:phage tail tape measure protein [Candidatus Copronaster equi]
QCEQAAKKVEEVGSKIENAGSKMKGISAAAGGVLVGSVKVASDFEDAMAKLNTIADTSKTSLDDLKTQIINLSNETGISSEEIANATYDAISAGQDTADAVNFVSNATSLARAGFADTGASIDLLTTILNAYGLKASEVGKVSDILIQTQNKGKTTVAQLSASMGKIIPTANSMNVKLDQIATGYTIMTAKGIATAETTTYMNSMLNELGKSGTGVSEALKTKTGKSFQELMASGKSLGDVLQILKEYANENKIGFNDLWGSAEAGKAAITLISDGASSFNSALKEMNESTGATSEAISKLDTPSQKAKESLQQIKNTGIELGSTLLNSLAPIIQKISEHIESFTKSFSKMSPETQKLIITILGIVAAASPMLIGIGKLTTGIGSIINFLPTLKNGISAVLGVTKGITAFISANPAVIIIAAIAAIIAILISLYKNCEPFREFVDKLVSSVVNFVQSIPEKIENLKTKFIKKATAIKEFFQNNWKDILLFILNPVAGAFNAMYKHNDKFREKVNTILDFFKNNWKELLLLIVNPISGAFALLYKHNDKFRNAVDSLKNDVVTKIKGAVDKIKNFFNFDWKLPHIKLPHFSMVGEFSLKNKTVPRLGVEWYAKAMENGIIMNSPTIFGINQNGQLLGGGEAGSETVVGTTSLMNMIKNSISTEFSKFALSKMIELKAAASQILNKTYNINNKVDVKIEHFENSANQDINELADEIEEIINDKMRKNERAYG